jgi:diketogulonate reductase-like aldo/keto reductase
LRHDLVHWPVSFFPVAIDPSKRGWENEDIDDSNNGLNIDETVSIHDVWNGMEHVLRLGIVRAIGVSNMPLMLLHELLSRTSTPPSVIQIELHPYLQQTALLKYCRRRKIHVQAYSPLGTPRYKEAHEPHVLNDPTLQRIANSHSISTAQLCILWALQRGTSIVTKSLKEEHLIDNIQLISAEGTPMITLPDEDMDDIAKLDRGYRFFRPQDWWGEKSMAVFD